MYAQVWPNDDRPGWFNHMYTTKTAKLQLQFQALVLHWLGRHWRRRTNNQVPKSSKVHPWQNNPLWHFNYSGGGNFFRNLETRETPPRHLESEQSNVFTIIHLIINTSTYIRPAQCFLVPMKNSQLFGDNADSSACPLSIHCLVGLAAGLGRRAGDWWVIMLILISMCLTIGAMMRMLWSQVWSGHNRPPSRGSSETEPKVGWKRSPRVHCCLCCSGNA